MKDALIIFVRKPEAGKVKTRLAATIGPEKALEIYKQLLQHTHTISKIVKADKFVFYANQIEEHDLWNTAGFTKKLQENLDLGGKMKAAFSLLLEQGYKKVLIIGSDCFQLSTADIELAFELLDDNEVVIGPSADGGYYLLGIKKLFSFLFENKNWSTKTLYEETIDDLKREGIGFINLITLTDVDTEDDWLKTKKV